MGRMQTLVGTHERRTLIVQEKARHRGEKP